MAGVFKRFRARDPVVPASIPSHEDSIAQSRTPPDTIESPEEKDDAVSTARDIQEAETNRKLTAFEQLHRWDPNLGQDRLEELDDAVNRRDGNAEGRIYDEVFENSPYPEVKRCDSYFFHCN